MPDYSKAVIYTIRSGDGLYVGSTCNYTKRKHDHKHHISNYNKKVYNAKLYKTIRENNGEWDMKPHKEFPCENKTQLTIEEERVRREMNADLNTNRCFRTKEEAEDYMNNKWRTYRIKNKEKNREYCYNYFQENKLNIYRKTHDIIECECGCKITKGGKSKHKKTNKHIELMKTI